MEKIKKGLGRGLSSLIGETKVEVQKNQLPVSDIIPNKYQPRKIFDEANLEDLTNSIKERGVIQPIIVRKSNNEKSKFEIDLSKQKESIDWLVWITSFWNVCEKIFAQINNRRKESLILLYIYSHSIVAGGLELMS